VAAAATGAPGRDGRKAMDDLNAPSTKGDIEQLRSEMNHQYRDLVGRIDDNMTRLIKFFNDIAETNRKHIAVF
jgi:hypothetical protein